MKCHWIQQQHKPGLILFFNGWGMDQHVVQHLHADAEHDLLMCFDYRDLEIETNILNTVNSYTDMSLVAWSMGVWAYTHVRRRFRPKLHRAIAINGSGYPVHEKYGISPGVYQATIDRFSEQGQQKFFKRMCASRDNFERFQTCRPQRALADQQQELIAIQQQSLTQTSRTQKALVPYFNCALISQQDRIIPSESQRRYWEGMTDYLYIDAPHFPFFLWKSWSAILDYATDHS